MTGTEVGLIAALCAIGGGLGGVLMSKNGNVSSKVCDVKSGAIADKVNQGFSDVKESLGEVKESIKRVDSKVDAWTQVVGDPSRGRRSLDNCLKGGSDG